ncbi:MAG: hypothetical protein RLZZ396_3187, partial [Planctomycetota bacterium]
MAEKDRERTLGVSEMISSFGCPAV